MNGNHQEERKGSSEFATSESVNQEEMDTDVVLLLLATLVTSSFARSYSPTANPLHVLGRAYSAVSGYSNLFPRDGCDEENLDNPTQHVQWIVFGEQDILEIGISLLTTI
ncbi:hypothetical protein C0J52_09766 [Blattella germanica]|nr:hypothetical protein C0J52_09766 [Blattella germanica]